MERFCSPGLLLLDKPAGMTSMSALSKLKKKLNLAKVGHAGTLDPLATGLLVCLLNGATRLAPFALSGLKRYSGVMTFGVSSNTDDIDGVITYSHQERPAESSVLSLASNFLGEIEQVPPQVSAVKVNGERSYKRARKGLKTELSARKVMISSFSLQKCDDEAVRKKFASDTQIVSYKYVIECSPGTYIRSIARDLGEALGCGGLITTLRREASEPFDTSSAISLEEASVDNILSWDVLFPHAETIVCDTELASKLQMGNQEALLDLTLNRESDACDLMMYVKKDSRAPLGLLKKSGNEWKIGVNISN